MGQHQGGTVHPGNDVCHGEGFARTGNAQKSLLLHAGIQPRYQLVDGLGLIPRGLIVGYQLESIPALPAHGRLSFPISEQIFVLILHLRAGPCQPGRTALAPAEDLCKKYTTNNRETSGSLPGKAKIFFPAKEKRGCRISRQSPFSEKFKAHQDPTPPGEAPAPPLERRGDLSSGSGALLV